MYNRILLYQQFTPVIQTGVVQGFLIQQMSRCSITPAQRCRGIVQVQSKAFSRLGGGCHRLVDQRIALTVCQRWQRDTRCLSPALQRLLEHGQSTGKKADKEQQPGGDAGPGMNALVGTHDIAANFHENPLSVKNRPQQSRLASPSLMAAVRQLVNR